ncbi:hypothetical protein RYX36_013113 [Vicia faba]
MLVLAKSEEDDCGSKKRKASHGGVFDGFLPAMVDGAATWVKENKEDRCNEGKLPPPRTTYQRPLSNVHQYQYDLIATITLIITICGKQA